MSVQENTKPIGIVSAADSDGDAVTLALIGGADAPLVTFNPTTGALSFRICAVNFESPADANVDNTYELTLSATDGKTTVTQDLRVAVTNVVEPTIGNGLVIRFGPTDTDSGSFSSGGDIDCDGFPETLVTSGYSSTFAGLPISYDAYVLFGEDLRKGSNQTIQLPGALGSGAGVRIRGAEKASPDFRSASFAGDVDGDGLGDVVVASTASNQIYVVFGDALLRARSGGGLIDLDTMPLGVDGVLINGLNRIVTGLGDVDGDGLDDIAFGGRFTSDLQYVVFGSAMKSERAQDGVIAAAQLSGSGAGVEMTWASRRIEFTRFETLAPAGDVDGDGLADLAVGAAGSSEVTFQNGEAFIVLGSAIKAAANMPGAIELTLIETRGQGMRIVGSLTAGSLVGSAVAGVGRLDNDAFGEIVVGAPFSPVASSGGVGQAAVIRGARLRASMQAQSSITWASLTTDGSTLVVSGVPFFGSGGQFNTGWAAGPAGDVDGDNLPDIVIGAPLKTNDPPVGFSTNAGSAYVLYGSGIAGLSALDLAAIPSSSVAVEIVANRGGDGSGNLPDLLFMGGLLAPLGDLDGDGLDEVAIGATPEGSSVNGGASRIARSGVFIVSGARFALAKAAGGPIRLRDMIQ